jgi:lysophospholipase L1-like esterase
MQRPSAERIVAVGLIGSGIVLVAVLVLGFGAGLFGDGSSSGPTVGGVAQASAAGTQTALPSPIATLSPWPSFASAPPPPPPPAASPASPALPAMLATIGDSYTQAWSVSPSYRRDHPGYSWAVGTVKGDGVFSLRERFEALGDKLVVVDAATSGRKMSDAARQATQIVAAAKTLRAGGTAYVTFELATNDLCDNPVTDAASFEAQLRAAVAILRSGLPAGSRILMLSVPNFAHFHDITQADARAKATLNLPSNSSTCAPFLGSNSPLTMPAAEQVMATYNSILVEVCDEIEATDGASGRLHCRDNEALLSESDFTIKDLSTVDYFHPSLSGQAKMAAAAWKASDWAGLKLPAGAAALAPGGPGGAAPAAVAPVLPLILGLRRLRRRTGSVGSPPATR